MAPGITSLSSAYCDWSVQSADGRIKVDATVPGQVQLDLLSAGIIHDPYLNYNDTA
jgi:hypothetical protein